MERVRRTQMSVDFGVDYYPEHWPEERWETDARLMKELGITVVRMGEFSWAKFQPQGKMFQFEWLDKAISLLGRHGIVTVLGTPSAAPPAWMIERHPEILPVDSSGQQKGFGGRHHDCQSNPVYRKYIKGLVTAMAEHYQDNEYVIGWQIDNELGNSHEDLCYCDSCKKEFGKWLEKKYDSIENLNKEWGTAFWSQDYNSFEQIPTPKVTPTAHNPSLLLDWKRFCSDLVVDFLNMQVDIVKSICPNQEVTHNLMGIYDKTDYFELAKKLNFVSNDQYPTGYYFDPPGQSTGEISACLDFIRSVKKKNFWMMELEAGATGGELIGRTPRPGQLRLWTTHCVAHGADTIVYFRWRTCLFGREQYWHGILPHDGNPQRRYMEIKDTIQCLRPVLKDVKGIVSKADVAILFSYDQDYAFKIQPHHPELDYVEQVTMYYESFYKRNIPVDFISPWEDMGNYKVVIAPLQYLMEQEQEEKFRRFVENGGCLLLTMRTGVKNMNNVCMSETGLPGNLKDVLGICVTEYDCLLGLEVELEWIDIGEEKKTMRGTAHKWCDILSLNGAKPLAFYRSEYYQDMPAITVNSYGKGSAYYVGTEPDAKLLLEISGLLAREYGLESVGDTPDDVELTIRKGRCNDYLFAMNHTGFIQRISIGSDWIPFTREEDETQLEAYETRIFWKNKG